MRVLVIFEAVEAIAFASLQAASRFCLLMHRVLHLTSIIYLSRENKNINQCNHVLIIYIMKIICLERLWGHS